MLHRVPPSVLFLIISQLSLRDTISVALSCRRLHFLVLQSSVLVEALTSLDSAMCDSTCLALSHALRLDNSASLTRLTIRVSADMPAVLRKMCTLLLLELHIVVDETADADENELLRLYQLVKQCRLASHPLTTFSVTYHAQNADDSNNSVRLMALVSLLNQLNWDVCTNVQLHLHINHLSDDPRLDLVRDLPVVLKIYGDQEPVVVDQAQLRLLAKTYSYLEGAF